MFLKPEEKKILEKKGRNVKAFLASQKSITLEEFANSNKMRITANPLDLNVSVYVNVCMQPSDDGCECEICAL